MLHRSTAPAAAGCCPPSPGPSGGAVASSRSGSPKRGTRKAYGWPGVGVRQPAGERIEHAVEHAEVHLGRARARSTRLSSSALSVSSGRDRRGRVDARGRHHQRHHQRRREAVRGHVAQHDAHPAAAEPGEGVEVAAHRVRRDSSAPPPRRRPAAPPGDGSSLSWRSCASSSSWRSRCCVRSRSTSRAFSTAAPIWLATAVTSFRSLRVKRSPPSRSVRLMTPTQRSGEPGAP